MHVFPHSELSAAWLFSAPRSSSCVIGVSLAGADLMSFLYREYLSYANFLESWAMTADSAEQALLLNEAVAVRSDADDVHKATDAYLWQDDLGYYLAYNTTARSLVTNRVFLMAFPVFGGMASDTQAEAALSAITQSDMYTQWGIRSTSNTDPRCVLVRIFASSIQCTCLGALIAPCVVQIHKRERHCALFQLERSCLDFAQCSPCLRV